MPDVFAVADVLLAHALAAHAGEIAIVAYYGSHAKGTASDTSDLDLFYVPDEGQAGSLCSQFILDGLPYDFWPVSWSFLEDIAAARGSRPWAVAASLLADAKPLYHRSPADLARFEGLQVQLATLLLPEKQDHMRWQAQEALQPVGFQLAQMQLAVARGDLTGLRWASWEFVNGVANCLALFNQRPFSKGWGANWNEVLALPQQPPDFAALLASIVWAESPAVRLHDATRLATAVRALLHDAQLATAQPRPARDVLADDYFFVHEYTQKVLAACARADRPGACFAAAQLQQEFSSFLNRVSPGFYPGAFNLPGEYDAQYRTAGFPDLLEAAAQGDLAELARRTERFATAVRDWFVANDVPLNIVADAAALRAFLQARDPA